ncbi:MAG: hypothetical protein WAM26_10475, partial [Nitrososphaeraceae archaeon]
LLVLCCFLYFWERVNQSNWNWDEVECEAPGESGGKKNERLCRFSLYVLSEFDTRKDRMSSKNNIPNTKNHMLITVK